MERIYVDTALLAVPNYAIDPIDAQRLIDRIGHFSLLSLPQIPISLVLSDECENLLWGGNCGPGYDEIAQFLELMEISEFYSVSDVLQQYHAIFARSDRSGSSCEMDVAGFSDIVIVPSLPAALAPAFLQNETERTFASVAALQLKDDGWCLGSGLSHSTICLYEVNVNVLSAGGSATQSHPPMPFVASGTVRAVTGLSDYVSEDAAQRIWRTALTADDLCLSIFLGALAMVRGIGMDKSYRDLHMFSIGPGFLESLTKVQASGTGRYSGAVRGLCSQIVAGMCQRHIGAFGRPNQIERGFDGSVGCRVHVTEGAEGLRLMFWEKNGTIEFSNVGVKRELWIDTGRAGESVSLNFADLL